MKKLNRDSRIHSRCCLQPTGHSWHTSITHRNGSVTYIQLIINSSGTNTDTQEIDCLEKETIM